MNKSTFKVFKTHTFKIHNLSKSKAKKIDKSMIQSSMAFYKCIQSQSSAAESLIHKDKVTKEEGLKIIRKELAELVKALPFGLAIKASTIEDSVAQLSSYVELSESGQDASLPSKVNHEIDYNEALSTLLNSTNVEVEEIAKNQLSKINKGDRETLSFYKNRVCDGFMLLRDTKGRLLVFVNLWSSRDKRAVKISGEFVDTRTNKVIKLNTKTGLLLPLSCSKWHEKAISSSISKSAKLYKRNNEYFLAVSFEYSIEKHECRTVMGVDRGIEEIASYVVRNIDTGKIIEKGNLSGCALREHQRKYEAKQKKEQRMGKKFTSAYSNYSDNLMHHVANSIIEVAKRHNSQVVIEDLTAIKNGSHHKRAIGVRKSNFSRMLSRQQYGKLEFMLEYKLPMVGLPKPKLVRAAYTSMTCPVCGCCDKANRNKDNSISRAVFKCTNCNFKEHSDLVGATNIAGKSMWLSAVGKKIKGKSLVGKYQNLQFNVWQSNNLSI